MDVKNYLKEAYKNQFKKFYHKDPTSDELSVFMNSWLGKNDEGMGDDSRKSFRSQFCFIYEFEPTEEQLDMFMSFMLSVIHDSGKVTEVCNVNHNKQSENQNKQTKAMMNY